MFCGDFYDYLFLLVFDFLYLYKQVKKVNSEFKQKFLYFLKGRNIFFYMQNFGKEECYLLEIMSLFN